jgi:urease accessory protein
MDADWLLWQIADSAFPTGSFAHSGGLEAAWQAGEVTDEVTMRAFLRGSILQAGYTGLPLLNAAHQQPARLAALDALCHVFLTNAVANSASRIQGRALISTCSRIWPSERLDSLAAASRWLHAHVAPIAGATFRALDVPLAQAQRLFLYQALRGVIAAAVRLGIIGSYRAQRLQFECGSDLDWVVARCERLDEHDLAQPAPLIDLWQSAHDRLYSRLFQS